MHAAPQKNNEKLIPKMIDLGAQKSPQSLPKAPQNESKIVPKINAKNEAKKDPKEDENSTLRNAKNIEKPKENQWKSKNNIDTFWHDFGSQKAPTMPPKTTPKRQKNEHKNKTKKEQKKKNQKKLT